MKIRLLADADLRQAIVRGLQRREPTIDFVPKRGVIAEAMPDPLELKLAAELDGVPSHFYRFIAATSAPGLILIPEA